MAYKVAKTCKAKSKLYKNSLDCTARKERETNLELHSNCHYMDSVGGTESTNLPRQEKECIPVD